MRNENVKIVIIIIKKFSVKNNYYYCNKNMNINI